MGGREAGTAWRGEQQGSGLLQRGCASPEPGICRPLTLLYLLCQGVRWKTEVLESDSYHLPTGCSSASYPTSLSLSLSLSLRIPTYLARWEGRNEIVSQHIFVLSPPIPQTHQDSFKMAASPARPTLVRAEVNYPGFLETEETLEEQEQRKKL